MITSGIAAWLRRAWRIVAGSEARKTVVLPAGHRTAMRQPSPKPTPFLLRRFSETPIARKAINTIKDRIACMRWRVQLRGDRPAAQGAIARINSLTACLEMPNADDSFRSLTEQVLWLCTVADPRVERDRLGGRDLRAGVGPGSSPRCEPGICAAARLHRAADSHSQGATDAEWSARFFIATLPCPERGVRWARPERRGGELSYPRLAAAVSWVEFFHHSPGEIGRQFTLGQLSLIAWQLNRRAMHHGNPDAESPDTFDLQNLTGSELARHLTRVGA